VEERVLECLGGAPEPSCHRAQELDGDRRIPRDRSQEAFDGEGQESALLDGPGLHRRGPATQQRELVEDLSCAE